MVQLWENDYIFSLVVQLVCCLAGGECNNQPLAEVAKAMDGQYKSNRAAAGKGWRSVRGRWLATKVSMIAR